MIEFLLDNKFIVPFFSTVGASLTIIILQSIHNFDKERKKKLYTVAYMAAVAQRLLHSSLVIKQNTIIPHIEAAKQIISGNQDLLNKTFLSDEFDILNEGMPEFNSLPEDYKVLLGYDDIDLLHAFETIIYMNKNDITRNNLNSFVKLNLKSKLAFENRSPEEQIDTLGIYWDYLDKLQHEEDRLIAFIVHIFFPKVLIYINRIEFRIYSKKNITNSINRANTIRGQFKSIIPDFSFFEQSVSGGIQRIIKRKK